MGLRSGKHSTLQWAFMRQTIRPAKRLFGSIALPGDKSLSRRPMERIMRPLGEMGAAIEARNGKFPPLTIHGGKLRAMDYSLPVASAQVKTCVLFAGLYADGITTVREPVRSRDHSEI